MLPEPNPKEYTAAVCMEIFRKYDPELFDYYYEKFQYFGCGARRYAEYLKHKHEGDDNEKRDISCNNER